MTQPWADHFATYPGDRRTAIGQAMGPDLFVGTWYPVEAVYDSAASKTRMGFSTRKPTEEEVLEAIGRATGIQVAV